jgi:hypothetical protein
MLLVKEKRGDYNIKLERKPCSLKSCQKTKSLRTGDYDENIELS